MQKNILQIDVEDWFCDIDFKNWSKCESRVVKTTERILELLKKTNNHATFFILGYVAEKFPKLVKKIKNAGHEIATHGYAHKRINEQTPEEFEKDLIKSIKLLEKITKTKVKGYRAPQFTITKKTFWALEILAKHRFLYDSSIFPMKTPLYGIENFPLCPSKVKLKNNKELWEFPPSVYKIPFLNKKIPIAGGIYLRFFPYFFIRNIIKRINNSGRPVIMFIHPCDIDKNKPKLKPINFLKYYSFDSTHKSLKWNHYYGLKSAERKFIKLLKDFKFISTEEWIKNETR